MSKIYVTGLGPGASDQMTVRAKKVLEKCPVIIGYTVYIDLIREEFPDPDPEDEEITKKVSFVNTGPVDCFARAKLVFGSQEAEDAVRMQMNGGQWKQEADGYYYYQKTLAPGEETEELLLALNVEGEISQEEKEFDLTVYVETVQALAGEDPLTAFSRLTK